MSGEIDLADLPERLRQRIVALVSDVLPAVTPLPSPLRKVAGFSRARRARLGGARVVAALADDDFRRRCAAQVEASPAPPDDELEAAARLWLRRGEGWEDPFADAVRRLADPRVDLDRDVEEIERLRASVSSLKKARDSARVEHQGRLDEARAENATLRRRLGETRRELRAAERDRDTASRERDEEVRRAEVAVRTAEAETRRLRSQLDEATSELSTSRRSVRSSRDAATVRAKLLLDTLVDSATGLRRELGLPASGGSPGDDIEADLLGQHAARATTAPAGPGALEQVLSLPHSRLIIDGYNVTKSAWASATLEAQRSRLAAALAPVAGRTGTEATIVFDAASATSRPVLPTPRGVKVIYSPPGVIADDVIRSLVAAEPQGRVVVVITNDQELSDDVRRAGARVMSSETLVGLFTQ